MKCFRRRRQQWASRRATIFRKRRMLPSGRECLSTPCARYIFRCSALCHFIHFYLPLPPILYPPFLLPARSIPVLYTSLSCLLLSRFILSPPLPSSPGLASPRLTPAPLRSAPLLLSCSLQRSIIFRSNDFTSRLDRSTTPTDVIAVRGHHMISQMSSCQHRRLVDFFISYPLISALQLSTPSPMCLSQSIVLWDIILYNCISLANNTIITAIYYSDILC